MGSVCKAFLPKLPIEALDIDVLNRLSRFNESELDVVLKDPKIKASLNRFDFMSVFFFLKF